MFFVVFKISQNTQCNVATKKIKCQALIDPKELLYQLKLTKNDTQYHLFNKANQKRYNVETQFKLEHADCNCTALAYITLKNTTLLTRKSWHDL
jgi:hypothetical protein